MAFFPTSLRPLSLTVGFVNKADETQANLAFVALRQEPFLVEEFDYLANQIQDLHEARVECGMGSRTLTLGLFLCFVCLLTPHERV